MEILQKFPKITRTTSQIYKLTKKVMQACFCESLVTGKAGIEYVSFHYGVGKIFGRTLTLLCFLCIVTLKCDLFEQWI